MSLFPEPPPAPEAPQPRRTAEAGPNGGPSYEHRGAVIDCLPGGHVCTLRWAEHPLHGKTFGALGTIVPLIDLWTEERRLPGYMRAVPKPST